MKAAHRTTGPNESIAQRTNIRYGRRKHQSKFLATCHFLANDDWRPENA
jgi:hypothetical protein